MQIGLSGFFAKPNHIEPPRRASPAKGADSSPTYAWVASRKGAGWAERKRSPTSSITALDRITMEIPAIPQQAVATREEPANGQ